MRYPRRAFVAATLALTMLASALGAAVVLDLDEPVAAAPTGTPASQRGGISTGGGILWESDADLQRDMDAIAAAGGQWIGFDINWNTTQYFSPSYLNWSAIDRMVTNAKARGLTILGTIAYTPPWARGSWAPQTDKSLPADVNQFAAFARLAVERYGPSGTNANLRNTIRHWQVWNEPNHRPFTEPRPDADRYTALLKATYTAIKAVDPGATVVTGGTAPSPDAADGTGYQPQTWLWAIYARGGGGYFDAVGHHPYAYPFNPLNGEPWNAYTQTAGLYDIMLANGDGAKKIWGTEAGAPTQGAYSVTESQQAQWIREYFTGWNTTFSQFTGPLFVYHHRDEGTNPSLNEHHFGLLRRDFSVKPSYAAYADVMHSSTTTPTTSPPGALGTGVVTLAPGRKTAPNPNGGYYVVSAYGNVVAYGGAPYLGSPSFPIPAARGIAVMPDGLGYVVLDGFGGLHKYGSARSGAVGAASPGYWPGWQIARDVEISPDGGGIAVLDAFGGLHAAGNAPRPTMGYWPGWDIARAFAYLPSGGALLLDGFGGIHAWGGARNLGNPYFSWDIARDLEVTPSGNGYSVLDGFGGVHVAGDAPRYTANLAYQRWDHAGGLAQISTGYAVAG